MTPMPLPADLPQSLVRTALANIDREFPHQLHQVLTDAADVRRPRDLHPAFYGCYDWHSAVHNHWLLVYALRRWPETTGLSDVVPALDEHLDGEALAAEEAFFRSSANRVVERPYGWVWVLRLDAELAICPHPHASTWRRALGGLTDLMRRGLSDYLRELPVPIDSGMHANTAYTLTLMLESARLLDDAETAKLARGLALRWYGDIEPGRLGPPAYVDFLDPRLAAVDLMSAVLDTGEFREWIRLSVPDITAIGVDQPSPAEAPDDPLSVHADGLPLTRAWALESASRTLGPDDPLTARLLARAEADTRLGVAHAVSGDFMADHWVPSFAGYLDARRHLPLPSPRPTENPVERPSTRPVSEEPSSGEDEPT